MPSDVSARPRCAWFISTTYEPRSTFCPVTTASLRSFVTWIPLKISHSTRRFASAFERWPAPTGITYAVGNSCIQLFSTSNGAGQHGGRASPATPRR